MTAGTAVLDRRVLDSDLLAAEIRAVESRHLDFRYLHRATPRSTGANRLAAFEAMPLADQEATWRALRQQRLDARYAAGDMELTSTRRKRRETAKRPLRAPAGRKLDELLDDLRQISAEDYLEHLAGVEPRRGRTACPLPDHEDRHPSASYSGVTWYCHRCSEGGDLISLASSVSGISTRGRSFIELIDWIGDRLPGFRDPIREALEARR